MSKKQMIEGIVKSLGEVGHTWSRAKVARFIKEDSGGGYELFERITPHDEAFFLEEILWRIARWKQIDEEAARYGD